MLRLQILRSSRLSLRLPRRQRQRSRRAPRRRAPNLRHRPILPRVIHFPWRSRKRRRKRMRNRRLRNRPSRCRIVLLQIQVRHRLRQQIQAENPDSLHRQKTIHFPRRSRKQRPRQTRTKEAKQEREILRDREFRSPVQPLLLKAATVRAMRIYRSPNLERAISERIPSWIPLHAIRRRMDESTTI